MRITDIINEKGRETKMIRSLMLISAFSFINMKIFVIIMIHANGSWDITPHICNLKNKYISYSLEKQ